MPTLALQVDSSWCFRCAQFALSSWLTLLQSVGFYRIRVLGLDNLNVANPCGSPAGQRAGLMYVAPHSTHNMEVLFMSSLLYRLTGRAVRGLGHRLMRLMLPHYGLFGMEIASPKTADFLLDHGESICVMPGGGEEMLGLYSPSPCSVKRVGIREYHWRSLSGRPRFGFARLALSNNVAIQPIELLGTERMCFAPLMYVLRWLGVLSLLRCVLRMRQGVNDSRCDPRGRLVYAVLTAVMYVLMFVVVTCQSMLVIPLPTELTLVIHRCMRGDPGESAESFAERVHRELYAKPVH